LLDDLPFSVRDPASGRFRIAFRVFCAAGFERGRPRVLRVEAFRDASQANWEAFLRALEGAPPRVVCDNHYGLGGAVRAAFPEAELYYPSPSAGRENRLHTGRVAGRRRETTYPTTPTSMRRSARP
jgi:hypothetical protein